MKITKFEVPTRVYRDGDSVLLEFDESNKKEIGSEPIPEGKENEILSISKAISDENETEKMVARGILLASENERNTIITLKLLTM